MQVHILPLIQKSDIFIKMKFRLLVHKILKEQIANTFLNNEELKEIMQGYIACALWTEEENIKEQLPNNNFSVADRDDNEESVFDKLIRTTNDSNKKSIDSLSIDDIDTDSLIQAYNDIKKFIDLAGEQAILYAIQEKGLQQLGHDFWLTRNHHGAGFFDHSYDDEVEKILTHAAQALKSVDMYVSDDMQITFSNSY